MPEGATMDDKDRLLMALLAKDARRSIVALARDLDLSRSATQDRLAKLVTSGAIRKFTIVEGEETAARETAHLLIRLDQGVKCAQVIPKLKAYATVTAIHSVAGDYDIIMRIDAINVSAIEATRASIVAVPGIASAMTILTLQPHLN
jgi:Lrp/AsnC family transcriptional regulator, leucine-responsive regulatory protein